MQPAYGLALFMLAIPLACAFGIACFLALDSAARRFNRGAH